MLHLVVVQADLLQLRDVRQAGEVRDLVVAQVREAQALQRGNPLDRAYVRLRDRNLHQTHLLRQVQLLQHRRVRQGQLRQLLKKYLLKY